MGVFSCQFEGCVNKQTGETRPVPNSHGNGQGSCRGILCFSSDFKNEAEKNEEHQSCLYSGAFKWRRKNELPILVIRMFDKLGI